MKLNLCRNSQRAHVQLICIYISNQIHSWKFKAWYVVKGNNLFYVISSSTEMCLCKWVEYIEKNAAKGKAMFVSCLHLWRKLKCHFVIRCVTMTVVCGVYKYIAEVISTYWKCMHCGLHCSSPVTLTKGKVAAAEFNHLSSVNGVS